MIRFFILSWIAVIIYLIMFPCLLLCWPCLSSQNKALLKGLHFPFVFYVMFSATFLPKREFHGMGYQKQVVMRLMKRFIGLPITIQRDVVLRQGEQAMKEIKHEMIVEQGFKAVRFGSNESESSFTLIWFYGGGWLYGHPFANAPLFMQWIAEIKKTKNIDLTIIAPFYPLTLEDSEDYGKYPVHLDRVELVYDYLRTKISPNRIALGGDSAGGGLALTLALRLAEKGKPQPHCIYPVSPFVHPTLIAVGKEDSLALSLLNEANRLYVGDGSGFDYAGLASDEMLGKISSIIRIWGGEREMLFPQIQQLSRRISKLRGVPIEEILEADKLGTHNSVILGNLLGDRETKAGLMFGRRIAEELILAKSTTINVH
jgi:acetyl esterase/lipase